MRRTVLRIGSAVLLLYASATTPGLAQENPQQAAISEQTAAPVIRVSSQLVVLDVLVKNKKTGASIDKLEAKDFVVREDGVPQQITAFSRDMLPLSVVFLFDLTDTVRPTLKPLAEGASEILGHLKPPDQVAIMVFSSHTELLQDFSQDHSLAAAAIAKASDMKSGEGTFIHEDMYEAVEQAMKSTPAESRRALVWLTDGTANLENSFTQKTIGPGAPPHLHSKQEAMNKLLQSGVSVAALIDRSPATDAFVAASFATPFAFMFGARVGDINHYADMTGGPVLNTSKKEVAARLAELLDQLRARYTLGYVPSSAKPAGTFCKTEVTLAVNAYKEHGGFRKSEAAVRARRGYYRGGE
jgi:VWFA-related protein